MWLGTKMCGIMHATFVGLVQSWNLSSNFPELEEVWKMEIKSGKMVKNLEYFFKSYNKCSISEFFSFWSNHTQSRVYVCSTSWKKLCSCVFKVPIDHLFDNLESGKSEIKKLLWQKKSGKNLEWCTLKSVRTLHLTWKPFF